MWGSAAADSLYRTLELLQGGAQLRLTACRTLELLQGVADSLYRTLELLQGGAQLCQSDPQLPAAANCM